MRWGIIKVPKGCGQQLILKVSVNSVFGICFGSIAWWHRKETWDYDKNIASIIALVQLLIEKAIPDRISESKRVPLKFDTSEEN